METPRSLDLFHRDVQAEMRRLLDGLALPLYNMVRYHMGWADTTGAPLDVYVGGKGLRPALCLLSAQAAGGNTQKALPLAASLELVHNFSLIHDDIQDRSPERHHRATVWQLWGDAQAINAGDSLFTIGRLALYGLLEQGLPAQKVLDIERILDETCLHLVEGQYLDLEFQSKLDITESDYLTMIGGKTAALMETSCYLGAYVASDDPSISQCFRALGRHLGYAFQIRDDVLGIWGRSQQMGKPVAEDIYNRKKSLPVVYALSNAQGPALQELQQMYGEGGLSASAVERALEILEAVGAQAYAQRLAAQHSEAAVAALNASGLANDAGEQLKELARFAVEREF